MVKVSYKRKDYYGQIPRGCSLTIPVTIKDQTGTPIDLTGTMVSFTVKKDKFDFDREDQMAYIAKDFSPQEPLNGNFYVKLNSQDTDFEPGDYFFDIQIVNVTSGAVFRACVLQFELTGAPTNRNVNNLDGECGIGDQILILGTNKGNEINIMSPTGMLSGAAWNKLMELEEAIEEIDLEAVEELTSRVTALEIEVGSIDDVLDNIIELQDSILGEA
ncbi:hypothetical protein [Massilibacteroides sp.]|uniref:hypothetical protein n=1 Tax=Massilibacteroides sp. TaxID=2034766 RepID=UPI0026296496|nr:hypothetical protein [Massilibacteroides sp.]MDD4516560.1 hypothetical protein [Massilibacteroides sp.]